MIPPHKAPSAPRFFQLRCALAYGAPLGVNGVILPYLPIWLAGLAFTEFEIGAVLSLQLLLRLLAAPVASLIADRLSERSLVLAWSGALSFLTAGAMLFVDDFWPVLLVIGIQAAVFAPFGAIVESIAVTGVRRWGFPYGSMRVWGSIGFMAAAFAVGEMRGHWGPQVIPPAIAFGFLLTIVAAFLTPRLGRSVMPTSGAGLHRGSLRRFDLHVLMIGASLAQASHGMFYTFGTIHWQESGFSSGAIGILWSSSVVFEIGVFFGAGWIAKRMSPWTLLRIGCAFAVLRWTLFPMPLNFWGYMVLQAMHAFTFAFVHLGLQHRFVECVSEEQESSVQGAYVFYNGVFLALSTLLSGYLYRQFGASSYIAMSVLALLGLATIGFASRLQPQRLSSGG